MSAATATPAKGKVRPSGPVPAGEPSPGPLAPPEQPQPATPAPAPAPAPSGPEPSTGPADLVPERGLDTEPVRDEYPLSVHEAIAEVTRRVRHIAKDKQTTGGERFSFRGIDDVLVELHPLLGEVGLVLMPHRIVERERETRATRNGGTLNVAHVTVEYLLVGPDGTSLIGSACGEAGDSGDKGTQKALSQAYKSFALQTFSIPTQESARDEPDAVHEPAQPWSESQLTRARTAAEAGDAATGYDRLYAVRQQAQAEGLLDVPVDGTALRVLLDARRAQLDAGGTS